MPDVCRANGFSETLKIGHLAAAHQVAVSPHVVHELSLQVAGALPNGFLVEYMDWAPDDLFEGCRVARTAPSASRATGPWHRAGARRREEVPDGLNFADTALLGVAARCSTAGGLIAVFTCGVATLCQQPELPLLSTLLSLRQSNSAGRSARILFQKLIINTARNSPTTRDFEMTSQRVSEVGAIAFII